MKALVTGGAGFLGRHLLRSLIGAGHNVVSFDLVDPGIPEVVAVRGDLGAHADVTAAVAAHRPETIFHCGALLAAGAEENLLGAIRANTDGTFHVLESARVFGVRRILFLSTISTYGDDVDRPIPEGAAQRPATIYGITKAYGERLGEYYARRFDIDFRGVRFPSVVGPGRRNTGGSAYTSLMIDEPAQGRPFRVPVSEATAMPIIYVEDAVRALLELAAASSPKRCVYNIAGMSPTAGEIVREVRRAIPDAPISFDPDPTTQSLVNSWSAAMDDSHARADWGWRLGFDLPALVDHFVAAARNSAPLTC